MNTIDTRFVEKSKRNFAKLFKTMNQLDGKLRYLMGMYITITTISVAFVTLTLGTILVLEIFKEKNEVLARTLTLEEAVEMKKRQDKKEEIAVIPVEFIGSQLTRD